MRARCRALDWGATPLGPVAGWGPSLRTIAAAVLGSRQPMFLFWGPAHVQLYNDAYRPSLGESRGEGDRHPRALGAKGRAFWTEIWDVIGPQIAQVMAGGEATWHEDQHLPIWRNGRLEDVWWTYSYSPVPGDDGGPDGPTVGGVLVTCQETTRRVLAERRQAFLAALDEQLRAAAGPEAAQDTAARLLGAHLGASRVGYAEDQGDGQTVAVVRHYTAPGVAGILGRFRYDHYGPALLAAFRAGRTVVRPDAAADPTLTPDERAAHAALALGATLNVPLRRADAGEGAAGAGGAPRLRAVFFVHYAGPHAFTADEVALAEAVAARTWDLVERARAEAAERAGRDFLRRVTDVVPSILYVYDLVERRTVWSNQGLTAVLGYTSAEIAAMGSAVLPTLLHPDDWPGYLEHAARLAALADDAVAEFTYRMRHADGTWRWLESRDMVFRRATRPGSMRPSGADGGACPGPVEQIVGAAADVTERRAAVAALAHAEERYRLATEAVAGYVYDLDVATNRVERSAGFADLTGYDAAAGAGDAAWWLTRIHPDDVARLRPALDRCLADPACASQAAEYRVRHADGRWVWLSDRQRVVRDAAGRATRLVGAVADVTALRHAEAEERRARARGAALQRVTAAFAAAPTRDAVGRVVLEHVLPALGATAGALVVRETDGTLEVVDAAGDPAGLPDSLRWLPLDAPLPVAEAARTGEPLWLESFDAAPARWPGLASSAASALVPLVAGERADGTTDGTTMIGVLVAEFDTARAFAAEDRALFLAVGRQCAQALERARLLAAEQGARAEAERLRRVAEEASAAKSRFLATMSHELRTPLNAIQGHAQLLEMEIHGPVTEAQRQTLDRIQRAQRHLLGLINNVLTFAKLETGKVEYDVREVELRDVLADLMALIGPQIRAKEHAYEVRLPDGPCLVWADHDKLRQVLLNLLANAVKFTPAGGRITAAHHTRPEVPGVVFLQVTDTGPGIPRDQQDAIFDPFVQVLAPPPARARPGGAGVGDRDADAAPVYTRVQEGTGLGLAISRELARGMGGDVRVRSVPGGGARFTVTLRRVVSATGEA